MKHKKSANSTDVLAVCAIGMVSIFVGFIVWAIVSSFIFPQVELSDEKIENITKGFQADEYEVSFSLKNTEKKSVKIAVKTKVGILTYRKRHNSSPKRNIYRVYQALSESANEYVLAPETTRKLKAIVSTTQEQYQKLQVNSETKIEPMVSIEKASWG